MSTEVKKINLRGNKLVRVEAFINITDLDNPILVEDDTKLDKANLPENIIKVWADFKRPSFSDAMVIELNQVVEKLIQGRLQRVFDASQQVIARIRVLLKDWSLTELDSELKLEFSNSIENPNVKLLTDRCMNMLGSISPAGLINILYNKAAQILYPEEWEFLLKLKGLTDAEQKNETPTTVQ